MRWNARRWFLLLAVVLSQCTLSPSHLPQPTAPPWPSPVPFVFPSPTASPTWPPLPTGTPPPPTPTPVYYTIRPGDTFSELALRFGVSVEALQKANPDLNPNALPVGATVVIPLDPTHVPGLATPTPPAGLNLGPVACYPTAENGAWCLAAVTNTTDSDWLHVTARLTVALLTEQGTWTYREGTLLSLAQRVPAGTSRPLVAYFPPPWAAHWRTFASVNQALPLAEAARKARFPEVTWTWQAVADPAGLWVRLQGQWKVTGQASWVRLVAWAVDDTGQVVAARAWTWEGPWPAESEQAFDALYLYLLTPTAAQVHVVVEAVHVP